MNEEKALKRKLIFLIIIPPILALCLLIFCIAEYGADSKEGLIGIGVLLAYTIVAVIAYLRLRPAISSTLVNYSLEQGKIQKELLRDLEIPYALLDENGNVMWANTRFYNTLGVTNKKRIRKPIDSYFPELMIQSFKQSETVKVNIEYDERFFEAMIKRLDLSTVFEPGEVAEEKGDNIVIALYLFDVTELKSYQKQCFDQKLIAGLLYVDNYDEVLTSLTDTQVTMGTALLDRMITRYFANFGAITKKLEKDKYIFVIQQQHMQTLRDSKFGLLDNVKGLNTYSDMRFTISIGLGAGSDSFVDCYENAKTAIGLALGRGGDQAVVKSGDSVEYFGGKSQGTEKNTRVKARVKAQALEELLVTKDRVIIMAHSRPDADAFGSAVGIYRLVSTYNKKAHIIVNEITSAIKPIANAFTGNSIYSDMIITSEQALQMIGPDTLVAVTDVNRPSITECPELLTKATSIVVIDHHRQSNEIIENATLSYIEPNASSACEMVAEILQYISEKPKIRPAEADAMYAGILIDTDNFAAKAGIRTFEAAAYLKQCGTDVTRVRKLFRGNMSEFKDKAKGIENAEIYKDNYAFSFVEPEEASDAPTVIAAKVANELLNIENIRASFVVTSVKGVLYVSARSVDDVNVQVIMEHFGGGGHANVAGVQLPDKTREEFFEELKAYLDNAYKEGEI